MNFFEAIASGFSNYVNFAGRARRSEYWWWALFAIVGSYGLLAIDTLVLRSEIPILQILFALGTFLPGLAVTIRRLHDIGKSGWWVLIALTIIGIIPLIYWYCQPSTPGPNEYGAQPA
jgi:uncharacterized membrane protein YhaH (DUF805 family)